MRGMGWESGIAAAVALAINALALWALSAVIRQGRLAEPAGSPLQVVWITRPSAQSMPSATQSGEVPAQPQAMRRPRTPPIPPPGAVAAPPALQASTAAEPKGARTLSAVYLAQARQQAQAAAEPFSTPDPLADRAVQLPGRTAGTFRMREPMSPARAVAIVGLLFGANDPKEPCRSNRARIADLGTAGESGRLQQELDFERRWCRP